MEESEPTPATNEPPPQGAEQVKPTDTTSATLAVSNCTACDGPHDDIEIHAFNSQAAPHTHWYRCPRTGDPVPLTIVTYAGHNVHIANDLTAMLIRAMMAGEFMVVVWRASGQQLHMERKCVKFPTAEFNRALSMLKDDVEKEMGPIGDILSLGTKVTNLGPIAPANALEPLAKLFGTQP